MEFVERRRVQQTKYTYLQDRFCTHCGARGIYEDEASEDWFDWGYSGAALFCFHCEQGPKPDLHNVDECLAGFRAGAPTVVDREEWTEQVSPFQIEMEDSMARFVRTWSQAMYGPSSPSTEEPVSGLGCLLREKEERLKRIDSLLLSNLSAHEVTRILINEPGEARETPLEDCD
jgi:hypothetical protein